jgi:hypothetical protein
LAQVNPEVNGLPGLPLTFSRPSPDRFTTSEQASGQSMVQAVTSLITCSFVSGIIGKLISRNH